ncbi:hypothetical protein PM082_007211 [Marasmius tenuissimus]|nr:hypothetical protein PM082_007211 [Marasmius tenuissimus]
MNGPPTSPWAVRYVPQPVAGELLVDRSTSWNDVIHSRSRIQKNFYIGWFSWDQASKSYDKLWILTPFSRPPKRHHEIPALVILRVARPADHNRGDITRSWIGLLVSPPNASLIISRSSRFPLKAPQTDKRFDGPFLLATDIRLYGIMPLITLVCSMVPASVLTT